MTSLKDFTASEIFNMTILERLSYYDWKIEFFAIGIIASYYIIYKIGAVYNDKIANNTFNAIIPNLKQNFYQVGVAENQLIAQDDGQHYTLYASGRSKIESFLAKIELQPRQNVFMWIMENIVSFFMDSIPRVDDVLTVEVDFDEETSENFDNFIWAIVTKDKMDKFRNQNYYLSLTKTSESTKLPNQFVFMNEVPEMNDVLFNKKLNDLLKANIATLKYLSITDQPIEKPTKIAELKPAKKVLIKFQLSNNAKNIEAVKNLINYVINDYADLISNRASFRPELTRKVKKTREIEYNKLKKQLDDLKRDELNMKKIEDQKKLKASMTPEEQQKFAKKQQERKQRKQLNRQKVRGSM